ncbi:MAG: D-aminoacylase [Candidatus Bathyarchaeota archaeon]|nr:MAG: D-aminoacylase [Candidatus Bathyarchaeota archaeon]
MLDLIFKNACVVDGTGNPRFKADIGIEGARIVKVGNLKCVKALHTIDASRLVASPGFIDIHSHSDFTLLVNSKAESKVRQGITTEVVGNCGSSAAPLNETLKEDLKETMPILEDAGVDLDWSTMKQYLDRLENQGIAINVVPLVGHANLRVCAMGFDNRSPTKTELEEMKKQLARTMEEGAFGMSTGLIYPPSCYASTDELIELSKVVADYEGIYTSHIRGEDDRLFDSLKEAITISNEARISVEISHHKAAGKANWGKIRETLEMISRARAQGADVTCDVYPYTAGSFGLASMLPHWAHEGGSEKLLERLKESNLRKQLRKDMEEGTQEWTSPLKAAGWDATIIARSRKHPEFEGRSIEDISRSRAVDPFDFVFDLLSDESAAVTVVRFAMCEEDVRWVMQHPFSMIGSDSSTVAPYGVLGQGKPHPRSYGTFPRVLGKYVRNEEILTLENAVQKMTSLPARKLGLKERGLIKEGMYADIAIFNPEIILDKATYADPHQYPEGVEYVLVNGKMIISKKEHTGALAGKALRKRFPE